MIFISLYPKQDGLMNLKKQREIREQIKLTCRNYVPIGKQNLTGENRKSILILSIIIQHRLMIFH